MYMGKQCTYQQYKDVFVWALTEVRENRMGFKRAAAEVHKQCGIEIKSNTLLKHIKYSG